MSDLKKKSVKNRLTQKSPVAAVDVGGNIAELLLGIVVPEYQTVFAELLLGQSVEAGVVEIALLRIGEETLGLGTAERGGRRLLLCLRAATDHR